MQLPGRKLEMNLHKLLARTKQQQQQNTRLLPKLAFNKVRLESLQNKRIWIVWPALKSGNSCSSPRTSLAHFSATAKIRSRLSSLSSQIEICSGCCKNKLLSGVCAQQGQRERERERGARPGNVHDFWQGLALPGIVPASVPVLSCLALAYPALAKWLYLQYGNIFHYPGQPRGLFRFLSLLLAPSPPSPPCHALHMSIDVTQLFSYLRIVLWYILSLSWHILWQYFWCAPPPVHTQTQPAAPLLSVRNCPLIWQYCQTNVKRCNTRANKSYTPNVKILSVIRLKHFWLARHKSLYNIYNT